MKYCELIEKIEADKTGLAKGYDINFLQEEFCFKYKPRSLEKLISNDLKLFKAIEKAILKAKKPLEGDFVEYDGNIARIARIYEDDTFQISNKIGVNISKGGYTSSSGCTWDPEITIDSSRLNFNNLTRTPKTKKGRCWMFSEGYAAASRGVSYEIDFKVWLLNK